MISKLYQLLRLNQAPLKIKLIITYIILTAIPMAIIGYFTYIENTKAIEEQVGEYIPRLLNQANKNIENEISQLNDLSNAIYNSSDVMAILRTSPYKEKSAFLQDEYTVESFLSKTYLDSNKSEIIGAFLLTNNGNYISAKIPYTGFNMSKSIIPFGEMHDLSGASPLILPNKTNLRFEDHSPFILLVNEIDDMENRGSLGTLILAVKVAFIEKLLNDIDEEERATMWLMDQNGYIIYHPDQTLIGTKDEELKNYPLINGSFRTTENNQGKILFSINQSSANKWILVHSIPMKYLTERTDAVKNVVIIIFILLVVVTTALSIFIAWSVTKPIGSLGKVMKEVEKGNLYVKIPPSNKDEVGELANSFQSMLVQLRELIKKNYEIELQQRDAKIYALQSQINPHFMYNTLETIGAVIEEEEAETATDMIAILGQMLRYSLSDGKSLVALKMEWVHIKNYLTLQKIRFEDRVTYQMEGEKLVDSYFTPKFIIQPIVENSFKYAMSKRNILHISIKITICKDRLLIVIKDNGPGMDKETLQALHKNLDSNDYFTKESGLGLTNVHARIKMMFNENYGLRIDSQQGKGTLVALKLPLIDQSNIEKFINIGDEGGGKNGES
ncbi:sensor histidine kinase [Niallia sp. NCCP-28]|uniref:cache domain-containing sensor histidine kinase n=1 Tax=Niallia sp. NCCP-28 TaxID=2934712 RepID=UPI00208BF978|nr:sensor histidine kinase [Niallia sp. NCCP-28]GKU81901.1 histidine kinase [Niallia sp. NCCP-28]